MLCLSLSPCVSHNAYHFAPEQRELGHRRWHRPRPLLPHPHFRTPGAGVRIRPFVCKAGNYAGLSVRPSSIGINANVVCPRPSSESEDGRQLRVAFLLGAPNQLTTNDLDKGI